MRKEKKQSLQSYIFSALNVSSMIIT